ncbi:hypothetical protein OB13_00610 [Pontibacter sp. HJ8]
MQLYESYTCSNLVTSLFTELRGEGFETRRLITQVYRPVANEGPVPYPEQTQPVFRMLLSIQDQRAAPGSYAQGRNKTAATWRAAAVPVS